MAESITVPIEDDGTGAHTAEIRIRDGLLTPLALVTVVQALAKSKAPVHLSFTLEHPAPLFVSARAAALSLGVTRAYIDKLLEAGHIEGVRWDDEDDDHPRAVIPWAAVMELAATAQEDQRMPRVKVDKKTKKVAVVKELTVTDVALEVMHEAWVRGHRGDDALKMGEIHLLVQERWGRPIAFTAMQATIGRLVNAGKLVVHRHEARGKGRPRFNAYEWAPEVVVPTAPPPGVPKLTPAKVAAARRSVRAGTSTIQQLAKRHGVTRQAMHAAVTGHTWSDVDSTAPPVVVAVGMSRKARAAEEKRRALAAEAERFGLDVKAVGR